MASSDVLKANHHFLTNNQTEVLGITQQKPKYPQYAVVTKRNESYKNWPDYLPLKPAVLVEAGLVYTGVGDSVRCFYCGGGLRNWERDDNPWEEHAKWYPNCPHVLLVKGQEYVDRIRRGEKPDMDGPKTEVVEPPTSGLDLINTVAARACIDMGFPEELVRKAIDNYFTKSGGKTNFKGQDLCEILFEMEDEEEPTDMGAAMAQNVVDTETDAIKTESEPEMEEEEVESVEELYEENRRLKENQVCKICLDDKASVIFLPCGHMVSCPQCAPALVKCPICRLAVKVLPGGTIDQVSNSLDADQMLSCSVSRLEPSSL